MTYATKDQASEQWESHNYIGDIYEITVPKRYHFKRVPLDKAKPSPGKKFMWGLTGDFKGYYYPTMEDCKQMAKRARARGRDTVVEKFELDEGTTAYAEI
jgi:hypothetical protein